MRGRRIVSALALLTLALPAAAASVSERQAPKQRPTAANVSPLGLKAFALRYDEPTRHAFPTNPAFAWRPTANATHYEFQVATASSFRENSIIYENKSLLSPTAVVPVTLSWATGSPYAYFARARAITDSGGTPWSRDFGFNVRWPNIPTPLPSPEGLLRWTPVVGATAYQVMEVNMFGTGAAAAETRVVATSTNVLDERDWYTFHTASSDTTWYKTIQWRVRAVRTYSRVVPKTDVPRTIFGPWSPLYTTVNNPRPLASTPLTLVGTDSDVVGTVSGPVAHGLMPGFAWSGNADLFKQPAELYRLYVFADRECLNPVYAGATVGSPAYAPRLGGTLQFPIDLAGLAASRRSVLKPGGEGFMVTGDGIPVTPSEQLNPNLVKVDPLDPRNLVKPPDEDPDVPPDATKPNDISSVDLTKLDVDSRWTELWDRNFPSSRYYWTVIPVSASSGAAFTATLVSEIDSKHIVVSQAGLKPTDPISIGSGPNTETDNVTGVAADGVTITLGSTLVNIHTGGETVTRAPGLNYHETELWQEACAAGRVSSFGKISQPVVTGGLKPFVSGLTSNGTVQSAASSNTPFYGVPAIAWQPALGADKYEIQWSLSADPFVSIVDKVVPSDQTALMGIHGLRFKPGTYYYRVRGLSFELPITARGLTWSKVQKVVIAEPSFAVSGG